MNSQLSNSFKSIQDHMDKLEADNQALRNELGALKASQNKIKADAVREAATELCDYPMAIVEADYKSLLEYANKLEAGK